MKRQVKWSILPLRKKKFTSKSKKVCWNHLSFKVLLTFTFKHCQLIRILIVMYSINYSKLYILYILLTLKQLNIHVHLAMCSQTWIERSSNWPIKTGAAYSRFCLKMFYRKKNVAVKPAGLLFNKGDHISRFDCKYLPIQ